MLSRTQSHARGSHAHKRSTSWPFMCILPATATSADVGWGQLGVCSAPMQRGVPVWVQYGGLICVPSQGGFQGRPYNPAPCSTRRTDQAVLCCERGAVAVPSPSRGSHTPRTHGLRAEIGEPCDRSHVRAHMPTRAHTCPPAGPPRGRPSGWGYVKRVPSYPPAAVAFASPGSGAQGACGFKGPSCCWRHCWPWPRHSSVSGAAGGGGESSGNRGT